MSSFWRPPCRPHSPNTGAPSGGDAGGKILRVLALGCLLALGMPAAFAQTHAFATTDGQTFQAQVVAVNGGEADLRREDGKVHRVDIATLSPADREFLRAWKIEAAQPKDMTATTEADIEIKITVGEAAAPPSAIGVPAGPARLRAFVTLANHETSVNYTGLKGTLVILAQDVAAPFFYHVLTVETFPCALPAKGTCELSSAAFRDVTNRASGQPWFEYKAYCFVLQSADGNVIQFHSSLPALKSASVALKLKAGGIYNLSFRSIGRFSPHSGTRSSSTPRLPVVGAGIPSA